jgi:hypothetical protein
VNARLGHEQRDEADVLLADIVVKKNPGKVIIIKVDRYAISLIESLKIRTKKSLKTRMVFNT